MPTKNIKGVDKTPGYEAFAHDTCSACRGVTCGFVHPGEHACECGEEVLPEVEVWDYSKQEFIHSIKCPGEKRVRVDYFGDMENLAVFEVIRGDGAVFYPVDGNRPLSDWAIDLS